ncbi:hypothetical protein [Hymenobacter baengnokdamensis]|uniref:hypothetical protein n=1 Tax=Hymenobacter baengnokdamensis TaxID=2615203 RepID=UPI001245F10F|nr:hypothetical protein [Hymenobacter baengnokdamensis]
MFNFRFLLLMACLLGAAPAWAQLYEVRQGQLPYAGRSQSSVNVVVDGSVDETRDFFQSFMKDSYRISFKSGLAGLLGKKTAIAAKQVAGTAISSRPVDLYAALTALTDSTTEVALFGGFGEKTFFSPDLTAAEFKHLQDMLEKYAPAARTNAYRQQVAEAEAKVAAVDKEKDKLNRAIESTRSNTAANLKRIDELLRQNKSNALLLRQDSVQLISNGQLHQTSSQILERRRARLSAVDHK